MPGTRIYRLAPVLFTLLLATTVTGVRAELPGGGVTTTEPDYTLEASVFINESSQVSEDNYREFLEELNQYISEEKKLNFQVEAKDIVSADFSEKNCYERASFAENQQEADLAFCVGPNQGGFSGARVNIIGTNTNNWEEPSTVYNTAHELMHFLGLQDLYVYPDEMPKKWITDNLMDYSWAEPNRINELQREIINYNLRKIGENPEKEARKVIEYRRSQPHHWTERKARLSENTEIIVDTVENTECSVKEIKRSRTGSRWIEKEEKETGPDGKIRFKLSDFRRNFGAKLECRHYKYWLPFFKLDRCFIDNDFQDPESCSFSCKEMAPSPGAWCEYDPSVSSTPEIKNFNAYSTGGELDVSLASDTKLEELEVEILEDGEPVETLETGNFEQRTARGSYTYYMPNPLDIEPGNYTARLAHAGDEEGASAAPVEDSVEIEPLCPVLRKGSARETVEILAVGGSRYENEDEMVEDFRYYFGTRDRGLFDVYPMNVSKERFTVRYAFGRQGSSRTDGERGPFREARYWRERCGADLAVYMAKKNYPNWRGGSLEKVARVEGVAEKVDRRKGAIGLIHEWGHLFGKVGDEYTAKEGKTEGTRPNCAPDRATAEDWWGEMASVTDRVGYEKGCIGSENVEAHPGKTIMGDGGHWRYGPVNDRKMLERLTEMTYPITNISVSRTQGSRKKFRVSWEKASHAIKVEIDGENRRKLFAHGTGSKEIEFENVPEKEFELTVETAKEIEEVSESDNRAVIECKDCGNEINAGIEAPSSVRKAEEFKLKVFTTDELESQGFQLLIEGPGEYRKKFENRKDIKLSFGENAQTGTYTVKLKKRDQNLLEGIRNIPGVENFIDDRTLAETEIRVNSGRAKWQSFCGPETDGIVGKIRCLREISVKCFRDDAADNCMENGENVIAQSVCHELLGYSYNPKEKNCHPRE